jgi:hypothetical protein
MSTETELLNAMESSMQIHRGKKESKQQWYSRLICSAIGRQMIVSLKDPSDNGPGVSVVHAKRRIENALSIYQEIFSGLINFELVPSDKLANYIYDLYLTSGFMYHIPDRVIPLSPVKGRIDKTLICIRGQVFDEYVSMSGLGFYQVLSDAGDLKNSAQTIFQLPDISLTDEWKDLLDLISHWEKLESPDDYEYLNTTNFSNGRAYFMQTLNHNVEYSLARTKIAMQGGARIYYLIHNVGKQTFMGQIPQWISDKGMYRHFSNCILYNLRKLPPSTFHEDGSLVKLNLGYLYPPEELNFLRLYSWPGSWYPDRPYVDNFFDRVLTSQFFTHYKTMMEARGYRFIKE